MANDEQPVSQMKVLSEIVNDLKNYPFLLVSVAALIVFSGAFALDIAKIKELKLLLTIIVIVSLGLQFYLMLRGQGHELDDVRFVLTLLLQPSERKHLRNLATGATANYGPSQPPRRAPKTSNARPYRKPS